MPAETVTIHGFKVPIPDGADIELIQAAAQRVEQEVQRIEANADRIDTQRFAMEAALAFATRLVQLEALNARDERELAAALSSIAGRIETIAADFEPEG